MKTTLRIVPLLFGAACLTAVAAYADARTDAYAHSNDHDHDHDLDVRGLDHDNIDIRDGDVVITADDGSVARISPLGDLSIRGKHVDVTPEQHKLLQRYALGIRDIQERGIEIGRHAVQMVSGMLGTVVTALVEGDADDDKDLDRKMEARAEPLKDEARALCKDVRSERQVQDAITVALPAFQPYAVIEPHPEHSCHIDGEEV